MTKFLEACENMMNVGKAIKLMKDNEVIGMKIDSLGNVDIDRLLDENTIEVDGKPLKFKSINDIRRKMGMGDIRYNVPKEAPNASEEMIDKTIMETEIYRRAKLAILKSRTLNNGSRTNILDVQRKQVAYGIDKYPEPLNPNTWSIVETIDHALDEAIDKLHYLVMLVIKMEQVLITEDIPYTYDRIENINSMIENAIEDMDYLVKLRMGIVAERNE